MSEFWLPVGRSVKLTTVERVRANLLPPRFPRPLCLQCQIVHLQCQTVYLLLYLLLPLSTVLTTTQRIHTWKCMSGLMVGLRQDSLARPIKAANWERDPMSKWLQLEQVLWSQPAAGWEPALRRSQSSLLMRCSESGSLFARLFSSRPFVLSLLPTSDPSRLPVSYNTCSKPASAQ